jgi:hypothetical protein
MASLLMILVALCVAAMAILSLASARSDSALTQRSLESTVAYYEAASKVQHALFAYDEALTLAREAAAGDPDDYAARASAIEPESITAEDGSLECRLTEPIAENSVLEVVLEVPRTLVGERFWVRSYRTVDISPWEERSFDVFIPDDAPDE